MESSTLTARKRENKLGLARKVYKQDEVKHSGLSSSASTPRQEAYELCTLQH